MNVKALEVDERGRIRLSIKALLPQPERTVVPTTEAHSEE